jgi:hypothetical protein
MIGQYLPNNNEKLQCYFAKKKFGTEPALGKRQLIETCLLYGGHRLLQCPCHFTASNFHPVSVQASTGEASRRTHVRLIHFDRQGIRLPCRQPCGDSAIDRVAAQPNAALLVVRSDYHAGQAVQGKGGPEPHRASVCVRAGLRCVVARLGRGKRRPPTLLAAPSRLTSLVFRTGPDRTGGSTAKRSNQSLHRSGSLKRLAMQSDR